MKALTNTIIVATILLLASVAGAQLVDEGTVGSATSRSILGTQPANSAFSLIDLSRVKWSNSYSVSFFSGGNYSGSVGLFNTMMNYDLTSNLSLALNLGVLHNAGALLGNGQSDATFLPGFRLDWRPSNRFSVSVAMQRYVGYYGSMLPYSQRLHYLNKPFNSNPKE